MSAPTTWPEEPTHSPRTRSHPRAPQPTSRARRPDPSPIFVRSCRPLGSHTRDCSCRRSNSEGWSASKYSSRGIRAHYLPARRGNSRKSRSHGTRCRSPRCKRTCRRRSARASPGRELAPSCSSTDDNHPGAGSSSRLVGSRAGNLGDVHASGCEPLPRDCRDRDDAHGDQDDASRLHSSPGSEPTNAATAVPTASIGRDPEATALLYASRARFSR